MATRSATLPRSFAPIGSWRIDASSSQLAFAVRHVMVSTVRGRFREFDGALEIGREGSARATAQIAADSIETDNAKRDASLRSPDFFWVEHHPTIRFVATAIQPGEHRRLSIAGRLTMRGVTRPVVLEGIVRGVTRDLSGAERIALALRASIRHSEFGIGRRVLEAHGVVLGDKVEVRAEISAVKAEVAAALAA